MINLKLAKIIALEDRQLVLYTKLAGDGSDRNFYRCQFQQESPWDEKTAVLLHIEKNPEYEATNYCQVLRYLNTHDIPVPKLEAANLAEGLVLLEDLGDAALQDYNEHEKLRNLYLQAIDILVKMHTNCQNDDQCPAFQRPFNFDIFMYELNFFLKHTLEGFYRKKLPNAIREAFQKEFEKLSRFCDTPLKVFTHRDYHSRNLMVKNEKIRVIDFQDAKVGHPFYDLASLLRDSYVKLETSLFNELFEKYCSQVKERFFPNQSLKELKRDFDFHSLQRNIKAAGSFGYLSTVKKKKYFAEYLPLTFKYIQATLDKYSDFEFLNYLFKNIIKT